MDGMQATVKTSMLTRRFGALMAVDHLNIEVTPGCIFLQSSSPASAAEIQPLILLI